MPLSDAQVRKAKGADRPYKLADSGGLYLFVTPTGFRSWRLKYRFAGKEKRLVFGPYPEVTLAEARDLRDAARRNLRADRDPSVIRVRQRAAARVSAETSFESVARRWHASQKERWSVVHAAKVIESLEANIFPGIGALPITEIDAPVVLDQLRKVERRGAIETAHRIRQRMSAVFVHAISEGLAVGDPAAIVTKALKPMPKKTPQPALLKLAPARQVLIAAESSTANAVTRLASRLLALTAARPSVVTGAMWTEFEGIDWQDDRLGPDVPLWRVPADRMKLEKDRKTEEAFEHLIPLSLQSVDVLRAARRLSGSSPLVFPSHRSLRRPMSGNALGYLYNRVGYHGRHVPHGWRASFSTIMNERVKKSGQESDRAVIDLMLAHVPKGISGSEGAYNRAAYMARRRELAQEWADLLMDGMGSAHAILDGD